MESVLIIDQSSLWNCIEHGTLKSLQCFHLIETFLMRFRFCSNSESLTEEVVGRQCCSRHFFPRWLDNFIQFLDFSSVFESLFDKQRDFAHFVVPEESWFAHFLSRDVDFLWRLKLVIQTHRKTGLLVLTWPTDDELTPDMKVNNFWVHGMSSINEQGDFFTTPTHQITQSGCWQELIFSRVEIWWIDGS